MIGWNLDELYSSRYLAELARDPNWGHSVSTSLADWEGFLLLGDGHLEAVYALRWWNWYDSLSDDQLRSWAARIRSESVAQELRYQGIYERYLVEISGPAAVGQPPAHGSD